MAKTIAVMTNGCCTTRFATSEAPRPTGLNLLGRDTCVFGGGNKLQILDPIIPTYTVDMMNMFVMGKSTTKRISHNKPMLSDITTIGGTQPDIATGKAASTALPERMVRAAGKLNHALSAAKLLSALDVGRENTIFLPAVCAHQDNSTTCWFPIHALNYPTERGGWQHRC